MVRTHPSLSPANRVATCNHIAPLRTHSNANNRFAQFQWGKKETRGREKMYFQTIFEYDECCRLVSPIATNLVVSTQSAECKQWSGFRDVDNLNTHFWAQVLLVRAFPCSTIVNRNVSILLYLLLNTMFVVVVGLH